MFIKFIMSRKPIIAVLVFVLSLCVLLSTNAQERLGNYQIRVVPDRSDWTYELNKTAKFTVSVTLDNHQTSGVPLNYKCGLDGMPPIVERTATTTSESLTIEAGTLKEPGFLRCVVSLERGGRTYRGLGTAGFRPDLIKPTTVDPPDFDEFWNDGKKELAKLPVDAKFESLPNLSTANVDVFQVNFQNVGAVRGKTSRIYGILAVPKQTNPNQKFPALLHVPGAGVRPYAGQITLAERGIITLQIGIHGIPVNLDSKIYENLAAGALNRYMYAGLDDRDEYYYRRVFLGCIRANDFLAGLPQFDGKNLAVMGGSQGGALSIMTAALDPRVKTLAVWIPALADLTGYAAGRAGGWHHVFDDAKNRTPEKIETSRYFDTVNFARRLKVPGIYTFGYNDETCPPSTMFAAYNSVGAPKKLMLALETGHALTNEQTERLHKWIESFLKNGKAE